MDEEFGDKLLGTFTLRVLQSVGQVRRMLDSESVPWEDFDSWLAETLASHVDTDNRPLKVERLCPDCGELLVLMSVNTTNKNRVEGNDWSSMWFCDECNWNELSAFPRVIESDKYMVEVTDEEWDKIQKSTVPDRNFKKSKTKTKKRIVSPRDHHMLYYRNPRRRLPR